MLDALNFELMMKAALFCNFKVKVMINVKIERFIEVC